LKDIVNDVYSMGSKQVRLDEDVYAEIADKKRPGETFSDAIDRMVSDWRLSDWGTGRSAEEIEAHRKRLEAMDRIEDEETESLRDELGLDDG
jgi:predicted CopG family antitoxin